MRLKTTINQQGQIYIPKKEREKIGMDTDQVEYIADARAILIIPADFSSKDVVASIEVILKHARHEAELEKHEESKPVEVTQ